MFWRQSSLKRWDHRSQKKNKANLTQSLKSWSWTALINSIWTIWQREATFHPILRNSFTRGVPKISFLKLLIPRCTRTRNQREEKNLKMRRIFSGRWGRSLKKSWEYDHYTFLFFFYFVFYLFINFFFFFFGFSSSTSTYFYSTSSFSWTFIYDSIPETSKHKILW